MKLLVDINILICRLKIYITVMPPRLQKMMAWLEKRAVLVMLSGVLLAPRYWPDPLLL